MSLYRGKQITVEAMRWVPCETDPDAYGEIVGWLSDSNTNFIVRSAFVGGHLLIIPGLEGDMVALPGDWVLKAGDGMYFQCPPALFEATYEKIEIE